VHAESREYFSELEKYGERKPSIASGLRQGLRR